MGCFFSFDAARSFSPLGVESGTSPNQFGGLIYLPNETSDAS